MPSYHHTVHFTLAEARQVLPTLIPQLERLRALKSRLDTAGFNIMQQQYFGGSNNGNVPHPPEWPEFVELAREVQSRGVQIKDFDRGLIDFPTIRANGDEVYLCYHLGEEDITAWHRIEDGFAGRRDITEL